MSAPHLLVIGAGSVGRRHAANLAALGCRISAVDPREDRLAQLASELGAHHGLHRDLDAALASHRDGRDGDDVFDGVVVASPTAHHVPQAMAALQARLPVLLEKPLGVDLASGGALERALADSGQPLLLGYTWRWWPALQRVRSLIAQGAIGEVRHLRCTLSAHLADWHPWEPYQDFFMASRALGGGALLDESHWIDLALWLLGPAADVFADVDRISDLEIDTDDNVDLVLRHTSGTRTVLHLDVHGRPHERSVTVSGSEGTIRWSDQPDVVAIGRGEGQGTWTEEAFDAARNDMFVAVAREFLGIVAGSDAPSCTLTDGLRVLEVVEAARRSSDEGRRVPIAEVSG